jgi:membrane protein
MRFGTFVRRLYKKFNDDAVTDSAAQLSYYFLFALFPFLFFLVTLTAFLPLRSSVDELMARLQAIMPAQALDLITAHLKELIATPRPKLLTFGLVLTVWSASRGVDAIRKALNLAYDVTESRPFWKTQGGAILMTVFGSILTLLAFTMILLGGKAGLWLANQVGAGQAFQLVWSWMRWPSTALIALLVIAAMYYVLPDVKQEFRFITPGSALATLTGLLGTWGFTQYADHFGKYNVTYGSIGGVVVLLTWLYLTGMIMIIGGEINAILEHASASGKDAGARAPDEAPAPKSLRPSAAPPGAAKNARSARESAAKAASPRPTPEDPHAR